MKHAQTHTYPCSVRPSPRAVGAWSASVRPVSSCVKHILMYNIYTLYKRVCECVRICGLCGAEIAGAGTSVLGEIVRDWFNECGLSVVSFCFGCFLTL